MVQLLLEVRDSIDATMSVGKTLRKSKSLSGNDSSKSNFYVSSGAAGGAEAEERFTVSASSPSKKCYFNSLEIAIGNVSLSGVVFLI